MALGEKGHRVSGRWCDNNLRQNQRKLVLGDKVEVRSEEEGLHGSWHPATITACTKGCREVTYAHLLSEEGSDKLVEAVSVSPSLDGLDSVTDERIYHRGKIRPKLPKADDVSVWDLPYGLCVDVYFQDAWWEGVVFDHDDGSAKRKIFFPDLGDELTAQIDVIRITHDWDAVTEIWQRRGTWILLELFEQYEREIYIAISVKQVWYDVRMKEGFKKLKEWTYPSRQEWEELVLKVIDDNLQITADGIFQQLKMSGCFSQCVLDADMKNVLNCRGEVADIIPDSCGVQKISDKQDELPKMKALQKKRVPSCLEENSSTKPDIRSDKIPVYKSKGREKANWLPVELDKEPCPGAVDQYLNSGKGPSGLLQTTIRKHLLYVGWKVDYLIDKWQCRYRYLSPDGQPEYSLVQVCNILRKSSKDSQLAVSEDAPQDLPGSSAHPTVPEEPQEIPQRPKHCPRQAASLVSGSKLQPQVYNYKPEYCPQAMVAYVDSSERGRGTEEGKSRQSKAKKHLSAVGWEFYHSEIRSLNTLRFKSPSGNVYNSLVTACKACIDDKTSEEGPAKSNYVIEEDEGRLTMKEMVSAANSKRKRKRSRSCSTPHVLHGRLKDQCDNQPKVKNQKLNASSSALKSGSGCSQPTRMLRSSKRVQKVVTPNSTHQNPRTVLSWLIDNSLIFPNEKVCYCSRKGEPSLLDGKICREGIECSCCQKVLTLSCFESHAGFDGNHAGCSDRIPASCIFLDDGRSLLDCQMQIMHERTKRTCRTRTSTMIKGIQGRGKNDYICTVCHYGGDLILCDECPSSFHKTCLGLEDVPEGEWFCPSCCCGICGQSKEDKEPIMHPDILICAQCERKYHTGCLQGGFNISVTDPEGNWFCSKKCKKISLDLHKLLGKQFPVGVGNLTWSLLKSRESETDNDATAESFSRLSIALDVMHECFEPVKERLTGRYIAEDIIFSRGSILNRLNFQGFYTLLLERDDEMITAANVRIHGEKVAEVPLVATRFNYRRQGMCRVLMNVLEKMLMDLGVERLVLPAVPSVLNTWTTAFGFSRMTKSERLQFVDHTFLDFQGTIMCQKRIMTTSAAEPSPSIGTNRQLSRSVDAIILDDSSADSEVCQPQQTDNSQIASQNLELTAGQKWGSCVDNSLQEFKQYNGGEYRIWLP